MNVARRFLADRAAVVCTFIAIARIVLHVAS